jgi:alpha-N-acetylglucosaminidase
MDVATPGQPARAFAKGLPQAWIDAQWELQRQILPKLRAFGMKPVLPGFQGNVPNGLMAQYPSANISRVGKPANALR